MFRKTALAAVLVFATLAGAGVAQAETRDLGLYPNDGPVVLTGDGRWSREDRAFRNDGWGRDNGYDAYGLLPPRRIERSLYRRGFDDVSIIRLRGPNYIAEAIGPRGNRVRVVVDGRTGEITGVRIIGWDRPRFGGDGDRTGFGGNWDGGRPWDRHTW